MVLKNCIWIISIKLLAAIIPVEVFAQGIYIGPGTNLVANGNVNIVLNNAGIVTNGNFIKGQSNVVFTGLENASPSTIGGSSPASFYNVTINRPLRKVQLNGDITVKGILTMTYGLLELNNHTLDLDSTGTISREVLVSRIVGANGGMVRKTTNLNGPWFINPGNIGIGIQTTANLGQTIITRKHVPQQLPNGYSGIQRVFSISTANNSNLNAAIKFYYNAGELNGNNEGALSLWTLPNAGSTWIDSGRDSINTKSKFLLKSGLDHFTDLTLATTQSEIWMRIDNSATTQSLMNQNNELPVKASVQVHPNPLQEQFVITIVASDPKKYVINLYNQFGQVLQSKISLCHKGVNRITWDMSGYAKGVYFVVLENGSKSIKVIKQ